MRIADGGLVARLEGHKSPISAVALDGPQQRVVAGSDGGSIRLWDVATQQSIRSFEGHKTAITCIDYHPFGEFIGTTSRDTHFRVWDVRKKSCLQVYKRVNASVEAVRFSPDGKWAATGCGGGFIRIYDLTAGKQLGAEYASHTSAITSVAFHQKELLFAAGSEDKTSSLWELDGFTKVFQTTSMIKPVGCVQFSDTSLLCSSHNVVRVYSLTGGTVQEANADSVSWSLEQAKDMIFNETTNEVWGTEPRGTAVAFCSFVQKPSKAKPGVEHRGLASQRLLELRALAKQTSEGSKPAEVAYANHDLKAEDASEAPNPAPMRQDTPSAVQPSGMNAHRLTAPKSPAVPSNPVAANPAPPEKRASPPPAEGQLVDDVLSTSVAMTSLMHRRVTHARVVRSLWPQDVHSALTHLEKVIQDGSDGGVVVDFVSSLNSQRMKERLTLDHLTQLGNLLQYVFQRHAYERALMSSLRLCRSLNTKFRQRIDEGIRGAVHLKNGVDLALEARVEKCRLAQEALDKCGALAAQYVSRGDSVGEEARLLLAELPIKPST